MIREQIGKGEEMNVKKNTLRYLRCGGRDTGCSV
jgi:hypothetical protein